MAINIIIDKKQEITIPIRRLTASDYNFYLYGLQYISMLPLTKLSFKPLDPNIGVN
jgi:hypothetical protein